jgi:hypothetical protein
MTGEACFLMWAPDHSPWSVWAKPVLFAQEAEMPASIAAEPLPILGLPEFWPAGAVVVDLPGEQSVAAGLALASRGFRPVPLFNGTSGPNPIVTVEPIRRALARGAEELARTPIDPNARPAFLLDAERMPKGVTAAPGRYDNRWIVLPQDCPSGVFLLSRGITHVTLVQRGDSVAQDLAHVLRRWQDAGVKMSLVDLGGADRTPRPFAVPRPPWFRWMWYAALAVAGLRRSYVGGFGGQVPETSGRSGFYG